MVYGAGLYLSETREQYDKRYIKGGYEIQITCCTKLCFFNQKETNWERTDSSVAIMEVALFTAFCNRSLKRHQMKL